MSEGVRSHSKSCAGGEGFLRGAASSNMAFDGNGDYVYLAPNRVNLQMAQERFPNIKFLETREIY